MITFISAYHKLLTTNKRGDFLVKNDFFDLRSVLRQKPTAFSEINGSVDYPQIHGTARFYQTEKGVVVALEVSGLPTTSNNCASPIFALHIHGGLSCTGSESDLFSDAGVHYNPHQCPHPYHAGDLPPLFGNDGFGFMILLTNRFAVYEIIGKTIVVHSSPDDFITQPSGNSGTKIACGEIRYR
jgi:Cu-Zn family superoxide dismutase